MDPSIQFTVNEIQRNRYDSALNQIWDWAKCLEESEEIVEYLEVFLFGYTIADGQTTV